MRRDAGMFDVSHMLAIDVRGAGARDFLQLLLANDVAQAARSRAKRSIRCMLNAAGGVLDDLIVYACPGTGSGIVVNAGTRGPDLAWMTAQRATIRAADRDRTAARSGDHRGAGAAGARKSAGARCPEIRGASAPLAYFQAALVGGYDGGAHRLYRRGRL